MSRIARLLRRTVVATLAATAVVGAGTQSAHAINPPQTQYSGVVNVLGGTSAYSIRNFWAATLPAWGYRYTNPTLRYYSAPVATRCGTLALGNSYWCPGDWTIWLDYTWNQQNVTTRGDFAAGGILAHEWGHAADSMTGTRAGTYRDEYHADCLAGLYYRYGYSGGRLLGSDYNEFSSWLYYQPQSATHGYGPNRAAWFRYGYQQYSKAACDSVYSAREGGSAAQRPGRYGTGPIVGTSAGALTGSAARVSFTRPAGLREVRAGELPALGTASMTGAPSRAAGR